MDTVYDIELKIYCGYFGVLSAWKPDSARNTGIWKRQKDETFNRILCDHSGGVSGASADTFYALCAFGTAGLLSGL